MKEKKIIQKLVDINQDITYKILEIKCLIQEEKIKKLEEQIQAKLKDN